MRLLILLFISSCGMNQLKPSYTELHRVTYSCPDGYLMAQDVTNRRFCVIKNNLNFIKTDPIKTNTGASVSKRLKLAKKHVKIDCSRVFKEANQCMR